MAFERFTDRARRALARAQEVAVARGHFIGAEHVLLALTEVDEGIAPVVLRELGVTTADTGAAIERRNPSKEQISTEAALSAIGVDLGAVQASVAESGAGSIDLPGGDRPPFSVAGKQFLERTLREALALQHNYIGTEHMLLAITNESESTAFAVLSDVGVDPEVVRSAVMAKLSGMTA